jgi:membrane-bound metal-dependent hydrolase YbcI (DUF457 family)
MPFPGFHALFNIGAFYPFRKYFGKYWLVFAGLSGLVPDLDFALQFILGESSIFAHGYFFHTFGFALCLLLLSLVVFLKNREYGKYGFIIAGGAFFHILLDYILGGGRYYLALFYPFYSGGFHLHLLMPFQGNDVFGILDAIAIFISLCVYYMILRTRKV